MDFSFELRRLAWPPALRCITWPDIRGSRKGSVCTACCSGYEPKCGHCAALTSVWRASCMCDDAGRSAVCRACSAKKVERQVFAPKSGGQGGLRKRGACAVHRQGVRDEAWNGLARRLTVGAVAHAQRPLPCCTHCTLHA